MTGDGVVIPVRRTAMRPAWADLPSGMRSLIEAEAGAPVLGSWSAGTGFTPGFASRLDLADGRRVFVKAASTADDRINGWPLSGAYRDEARKLTALPPGIGAPRLLWHRDVEMDGLRWIVLGLEYVDGAPPRRPWRRDELRLVLDKLAATASALSDVPAGLQIARVEDELLGGLERRLIQIRGLGDRDWARLIEGLSQGAAEVVRGLGIVHLDLRDDNILIDGTGHVWFVDWNWPALGAPWIDLVCLLISVNGDGLDADAYLAEHPLTRDVDPRAVDCLLAALWSHWAVGRHQDVPIKSPHLRTHQAWYADATKTWLTTRRPSR